MKQQKFRKSAIIVPATALLIAITGAGTVYAHGLRANNKSTAITEKTVDGDNMELHEEMRIAIENADYEKFKSLLDKVSFEVPMDEEIFAKMVEAHNLMMQGDMDGAHEIMAEIDYPMMNMHKAMHGDVSDAVLKNAKALREANDFDNMMGNGMMEQKMMNDEMMTA